MEERSERIGIDQQPFALKSITPQFYWLTPIIVALEKSLLFFGIVIVLAIEFQMSMSTQ